MRRLLESTLASHTGRDRDLIRVGYRAGQEILTAEEAKEYASCEIIQSASFR